MRTCTTWSVLCTIFGVFVTFMFAAGAANEAPEKGFLETALRPFQELDSASTLCLVAGACAFFAALFFGPGVRSAAQADDRTFARKLLEAGSTVNTSVVCSVIGILVSYGLGWLVPTQISRESLGALATVALLGTTFGLVFAVWLLLGFRPKSQRMYFSLLAVNVMAVGVMGVTFLLGIQ